jgi:hypothetical protein
VRPSISRYGGRRRSGRWVGLAAAVAIAAAAAIPASASAAPCTAESGATEWAASVSGSFNDDANWTQGGPSEFCDAMIGQSGTYTVTLMAGATVKSLTLNAGTLTGAGTINGPVQNSGGIVQPGEGLGKLSVNGSYTQEAGGRLEIEVAGTGAGQHDELEVTGDLVRRGTLALIPTGTFPDSSAVGEKFTFLTYGGELLEEFAQTTVSPSLACPKQFTVSPGTLKSLQATVVSSGADCGGGGGGGPAAMALPVLAPPPPVPNTRIGVHPGPRVTTKLARLRVSFGFSSDLPGAGFECKLDKAAYKTCMSPKAFKVKSGKHRFSVRAVGPGGTDTTPVTYRFRVIKQKG